MKGMTIEDRVEHMSRIGEAACEVTVFKFVTRAKDEV